MPAFAWGYWEETWPDGQFCCVFVETNPASDGMIHASGLYHAMAGESFRDLDTFQDRIAERAIITIDDNGGLLVKEEFAELLTALPIFLRDVSRRLGLLGSHESHCRTG